MCPKDFHGQFTLEWDASVLDLVTEVNSDAGATEVNIWLTGVTSSVTIPGLGNFDVLFWREFQLSRQ